jgi:hypothetical protein
MNAPAPHPGRPRRAAALVAVALSAALGATALAGHAALASAPPPPPTAPAPAPPPPTAPAPAVGAAAAAQPADVAAVLSAFAAMPGLEARFEETKHLALLAAPLVSSGRLYFAPPGTLARVVEAPAESKIVITPTALRYEDAAGGGAIDLRARPDVKLFVESFARVLAGDRAGLETIYTLRFEPQRQGAPWLLELVPKGPPLSQLVKHLRVRGVGLAVQDIRVVEAAGDETVTRILAADPTRRFTAQERQRLFGVAPK